MYKKLAENLYKLIEKRLSDALLTKNTIIIYGLELIIASCINFVIICILGSILVGFINTLVYILSYRSIRKYAGGYHAKTYSRCTIYFTSIFLILITLKKYVYTDTIVHIITFVISCLIIIINAPIDSKNKRLTEIQIVKYKKLTIIVLAINILIFTILLFSRNSISIYILLALVTEDIMLILGMIENKLNTG